MSRLLIGPQDFESDSSPLSLSGTMARSNVSPLAGSWSLRGGNGAAADGAASYTPASADRPVTGGIRGARIYATYLFRRSVGPTGGAVTVFNTQWGATLGNNGLLIVDGGSVLRSSILSSAVNGSTSLSTSTTYRVEQLLEWSLDGARQRVWLDGASEIDHIVQRVAGIPSDIALTGLVMAGVTGGKTTWDFRWDDMTVRYSVDPQ